VKDDKNTIIGGIEVTLEITKLKNAEALLRESEQRYRSLAESSLVGIWQITLDGYTLYVNPAMCRMLEIEDPEELHGKTYESFYDNKNQEIIKRQLANREKGLSSAYEVELTGRKGTKRNVVISGAPICLSKNKIHSTIGTLTDITDRKKAEKALIKAHNELEKRVKQRTSELETKKKGLEELNTAMKILLNKREEDKTNIEKNVMTNVKKLIEPYVEKIKKTKLDDQQKALLSIVESNINEIVSPFTRTMSLKYLNLTSTEIRIANLIRKGSKTKDIAEIMKVSPKTVETHRKNIRRKIGLDGKRANLRSHLLSFH
jgi:PAS domain S-box-containing protein